MKLHVLITRYYSEHTTLTHSQVLKKQILSSGNIDMETLIWNKILHDLIALVMPKQE